MVGRAAQGRPWLVAVLSAELTGSPVPECPKGEDLVALISEHYEDMLRFYGRDVGVRVARKHLGWYLEHLNDGPALKRGLQTMTDPKAVLTALRDVASLEPLADIEDAA